MQTNQQLSDTEGIIREALEKEYTDINMFVHLSLSLDLTLPGVPPNQSIARFLLVCLDVIRNRWNEMSLEEFDRRLGHLATLCEAYLLAG